MAKIHFFIKKTSKYHYYYILRACLNFIKKKFYSMKTENRIRQTEFISVSHPDLP
ncbi:hypothetical protein [Tenacibaculum piscium]|uniref:hypothetical protein n=1 Tax=Tenacibaculum piscium TaxID=1458515 RepID=UPI001F1FF2DB|nr:hypothetical protein [Tenacibaculum piscium]